MPRYAYPDYPFVRPPEMQPGAEKPRHRVAIAGGGPVGLTLALDLASRGIGSVVLQASNTLSEGSRALCWAKRTLEILDRLGCGAAIAERGFTWNTGRLFHGDREVYAFDLTPERDSKFPAFVNLQQYYAEEAMVTAVERQADLIDLRWRHKVFDVTPLEDGVAVHVETPEGPYGLDCDWLVACDGARSSVRRAMGLPFEGRVFEDNFLIADIDTAEEIPWTERRFWFLPTFHPGETALCHRQGDGMWRVDFQLGWEGVDREAELTPERALPRIRAMLGVDDIELTWLSMYTFQCRRLEKLRHGRVLFAGDAAHQVSPFGARGGNSGIQDAENLAWKLALVLKGLAPEALVDSYHDERSCAADENIRITSRTVDFMTAKTPMRARFREAVLGLARNHPFARALINSGRLSTPTIHVESPLNGDDEGFAGGPVPGGPVPGVKLSGHATATHLIDLLGRSPGFDGLYFAGDDPVPSSLAALARQPVPVWSFVVGGPDADLQDPEERLVRAFDAPPGSFYLLRPDQHVAARWRRFDEAKVLRALDRALARDAVQLARAGE